MAQKRITLLRTGAVAAALLTALPALPASASTPQARTVALACPADRVDGAEFTDVGTGVHSGAVECLSWYGITQGGGDGTFDPQREVTRAQMASFLVRVLEDAGVEIPEGAPNYFTDDEGNTHEANLNLLASFGIILGAGDGTVSPNAPVRRDQMASFLVRLLELVGAEELEDTFEDYFDDDEENTHSGAINALAGLGIATGRSEGAFDPASPVLREQMASFLTRLLDKLVEDGEVRVPATLRLPTEEVDPGQTVQAEVLGEDVATVDLAGCGLDGEVTDADAGTEGVQFEIVVPSSFPAGADGETSDECELTAHVTFTDGNVQELEGELEYRDGDESTDPTDGDESADPSDDESATP